MDILKFKGYEGTAELDMVRQVCRGKILFINDLVTYEASSPANLQHEFEEAVDDYLKTCSELAREPQKPFRGLFNVRIPPTIHRSAVLRAASDGVTLNDLVFRAIEAYLNQPSAQDSKLRMELVTTTPSRTVHAGSASGRTSWYGTGSGSVH
ncbi:MAG: type II toxin-antitoxin system HicB family antitoxin [Holophagaceae bacterium]|nr:type II toxin-antitoxin system HicB family antitoxin [Holophagaceae bacterium]